MSKNEMLMIELKNIYTQISAKELILDVRSPEEFRSGHVPGSRNIPYDQVGQFADELKKLDRIYVHCQAGMRSVKAFQELSRHGLKNLVCVTHSGMKDWIEAGLPVEKG